MKISVIVKPGSKVGPLIKDSDQKITVYVRERAIDGKANEAVAELLADYYKVSKSRVKLLKGLTSKTKLFEIDN